MKISAAGCFLLLSVCSCRENTDEQCWKYESGFHVEDILSFGGRYNLRSDTLFYFDSAIAAVSFHLTNQELELRSLSNGQTGFYTLFQPGGESAKLIIEQIPAEAQSPPAEPAPALPDSFR